jgi:AcrR family transcriptional regulator
MTSVDAAGPAKRHLRRGPREVQDLVLKAAHRLLTGQAFHGTTTRQFAEEAGVGEAVLFRNFGSEAGLFERAIFKPFTEFLTDWVVAWDRESPASTDAEKIVRSFVSCFSGSFRSSRIAAASAGMCRRHELNGAGRLVALTPPERRPRATQHLKLLSRNILLSRNRKLERLAMPLRRTGSGRHPSSPM